MIIALASPRVSTSLDDALARIDRLLADASRRGAEIACFPEAYLPGLRGQDFEVWNWDHATEARALAALRDIVRTHGVSTIMGMEHVTPQGRQIAAFVFDARGELLGSQTKNQLDPSEDRFYVPGTGRRIFEVNGVKFGNAI
ncbi:MAG TPA: carbon-nitrogen hydrolase family protein, partial [Gemmatimonadaceae bacterium]|nr:carbon-nitrogen hydrolase family protein [Gemmatimonadaceae bacterium]